MVLNVFIMLMFYFKLSLLYLRQGNAAKIYELKLSSRAEIELVNSLEYRATAQLCVTMAWDWDWTGRSRLRQWRPLRFLARIFSYAKQLVEIVIWCLLHTAIIFKKYIYIYY